MTHAQGSTAPVSVDLSPLLEYRRLLARLFQLRALGPVSDETEEQIATALSDCRSKMTECEERQIAALIDSVAKDKQIAT